MVNGVIDESYNTLIAGQRELETGREDALAGRMELMQGDAQ